MQLQGFKIYKTRMHLFTYIIITHQGDIKMRGIKKLTTYSRKVSFVKDSRLDVRAPSLSQDLPILPPGTDGDDGKHGVHGPTGNYRVLLVINIYGNHT